MWDILWFVAVISLSIWSFMLSVLVTIKFVMSAVAHKTTSEQIMNELLLKYGIWWGSTLIAVVLS